MIELLQKWYLVTVDDPHFLPGQSIYKLIELLLSKVLYKFVILFDIEGAGNDGLIYSFQQQENAVIGLNEFLKKLSHIIQFDWGDFYLFEEYPSHWLNTNREYYYNRMGLTYTTIRAVDGQYIYVYTRKQEIVELITSNYITESVKTNFLNRLEYPC